MDGVRVKCQRCNKVFLKDGRHYRESLKLGRKFYCSHLCADLARHNRKTLACEAPSCGKTFERTPANISLHNYCSHSCAARVINIQTRKTRICLKCGKEFYIKRKYCSIECRPTTPIKYTREMLIDKIKAFYRTHKRIPVKREFYSIWQAYRRVFGNWNAAIVEAGFQPNPERFTHKFVARDGHVCDSLSEMIIDNWLSRHKLPHKHGVYYPGQARFSADFVVNGKYWIEFFGLKGQLKIYDRLLVQKEKLAARCGIQLIKLFPADIFPKSTIHEKLNFLLQ
jgi:hypothetical protein